MERSLRMTYDREADAAYLYVTDPIQPGEAAESAVLEGRREFVDLEADDAFTSIEAARSALEVSLEDLRASGATRASLLGRGRVVEVRNLSF